MALVLTVGILAFLLVLAAASSPALLAAWARATSRERELEMWQVMRRRGLVADDASLNAADMAHAIRRCRLCPSVDACRAWLASGRSEGSDEFCPNERFFRSLDSAQHR
jgi:hypothetical protein